MATTEDRLAGVEELERLYKSPDASPPQGRSEPERTSGRTQSVVLAKDARRLLIAWIAVVGAVLLFEPSPANADPVIPMWAEFAAAGFLFSLYGTMFGLSTRRPWALRASMLAVGFGAVLAIACAATGHHTGSWWAYELTAFGGLGAMTRGAKRRAR
jgi:hypothetical protein